MTSSNDLTSGESGTSETANDNARAPPEALGMLADLAREVVLEMMAVFKADGYITSAECAAVIRDACDRVEGSDETVLAGVRAARFIADELTR